MLRFQEDLAFSEKVTDDLLKALLKTEVRKCTDASLQKAGVDFWVLREGRWLAVDLKVSRHPYRERILVEILEYPKVGLPKPGWAARLGKTEAVLFFYFRPKVMAIEVSFIELYAYARRRLYEVLLGAKTDSSVIREGRIALFDLPETKTFEHKIYTL